MNKYLIKIKDQLLKYYGFIIIIIEIIFLCYIIFLNYQILSALNSQSNTFLSPTKNTLNTELYQKIISNIESKKNPPNISLKNDLF